MFFVLSFIYLMPVEWGTNSKLYILESKEQNSVEIVGRHRRCVQIQNTNAENICTRCEVYSLFHKHVHEPFCMFETQINTWNYPVKNLFCSKCVAANSTLFFISLLLRKRISSFIVLRSSLRISEAGSLSFICSLSYPLGCSFFRPCLAPNKLYDVTS